MTFRKMCFVTDLKTGSQILFSNDELLILLYRFKFDLNRKKQIYNGLMYKRFDPEMICALRTKTIQARRGT